MHGTHDHSKKWGKSAAEALFTIMRSHPRDTITSKEISLLLNEQKQTWVYDEAQVDSKISDLRRTSRAFRDMELDQRAAAIVLNPAVPAEGERVVVRPPILVPASRPAKDYARLRLQAFQHSIAQNAALIAPVGIPVASPAIQLPPLAAQPILQLAQGVPIAEVPAHAPEPLPAQVQQPLLGSRASPPAQLYFFLLG